MQLAFARVKESWEDAYLTSLAGRPVRGDRRPGPDRREGRPVLERRPPAPSRIFRELLDRGIDYFKAYVCENLGSPDERVTQGELAELAGPGVRPAQRPDPRSGSPTGPTGPGGRAGIASSATPTTLFAQSQPKRGLITQAEVRSIALAQLDIRPTSVVWDIGAGSGSVAIEAAQLASQGMVYAVEPEAGDLAR